jgi:Fe-S cluster assembly protein SufD
MALMTPILKPAPLVKSGELTREFVEAYSAALNEPEWITERRVEAWRMFKETPPPNRHDEIWRRVDLSTFKLDQLIGVIDASKPPRQAPSNWPVLETAANARNWMLHVNGDCIDYRQGQSLIDQGVIFADLATAIQYRSKWLAEHLMHTVKITDSYFAALHAVFMRGGVVLYVPKGVQIDEPLRAATWMTADQRTGFNHTLIVLEEGAKATLIEEFASATPPLPASRSGSQVFYNGAVEIVLGKGAQLDYVNIQDWGRNVWNFTTERANVGEEATLHWVVGGIGAKFTKSLIEADLTGPRGTALLSGVYFADTKQHMHYDTQQNHIAEACKSDLLYKAALRDEARTVWRGNIRVFPGAQKTDGYQANRNLQLSHESRADSIPGLEIEADDVRCTHGSTIGNIEHEPMFYLESRGIPESEARRLIVEGFFAPVIERIPLEETRERLTEEIGKKID